MKLSNSILSYARDSIVVYASKFTVSVTISDLKDIKVKNVIRRWGQGAKDARFYNSEFIRTFNRSTKDARHLNNKGKW